METGGYDVVVEVNEGMLNRFMELAHCIGKFPVFSGVYTLPIENVPESLQDMVRSDGYYLDPGVLLHPHIPTVPGSEPPSAYHYIPCAEDAPPDTVVLFPNVRAGPEGQFVMFRGLGVGRMPRDEYEAAVRAAGFDYDSLPPAR